MREKECENSSSLSLEVNMIAGFRHHLIETERSAATLAKYTRDVKKLYVFLQKRPLDKERMLEFKEYLISNYKVSSVNSILAGINHFLDYIGMSECRVKQLTVQKKVFWAQERELKHAEYVRLVEAARDKHDERLSLLLQTICSTGIRVSEIPYITVEAVRAGAAEVNCKGKTRVVMIPRRLQAALKSYIVDQDIRSGYVFRTKSGQPMNRSNIWKAMKRLCKAAGVAPGKVFPHNLRHLFARTFYNLKKDVVKLADVLGHSQIETTRGYTISTGTEHRRQMEALNLVL